MKNLTIAIEWLGKIQEKLAEVQGMLEDETSSDILNQNWVEIPDANFRAFLKQSYPTCFNSQDMMDTTCTAVLGARTIDCINKNIANLQGIQYFKGLINLDCSGNSLTSLPALPSGLKVLDCSMNRLTSLPVLPSGLRYYSGRCNNY
jgi:hypothetical protein